MRFTHKYKFKIRKLKTCYIPAFTNLLQTKLRNIHNTELIRTPWNIQDEDFYAKMTKDFQSLPISTQKKIYLISLTRFLIQVHVYKLKQTMSYFTKLFKQPWELMRVVLIKTGFRMCGIFSSQQSAIDISQLSCN